MVQSVLRRNVTRCQALPNILNLQNGAQKCIFAAILKTHLGRLWLHFLVCSFFVIVVFHFNRLLGVPVCRPILIQS